MGSLGCWVWRSHSDRHIDSRHVADLGAHRRADLHNALRLVEAHDRVEAVTSNTREGIREGVAIDRERETALFRLERHAHVFMRVHRRGRSNEVAGAVQVSIEGTENPLKGKGASTRLGRSVTRVCHVPWPAWPSHRTVSRQPDRLGERARQRQCPTHHSTHR
jgi:hypothetical protein